MTNVRMKAVDTLHISSLSQHAFAPGDEFEINSTDAKSLEDRGLATTLGDVSEQKAAPPVENKMEPPIENKSEPAAPVAKAAPKAKAKAAS